jgi:hypothetical protein
MFASRLAVMVLISLLINAQLCISDQVVLPLNDPSVLANATYALTELVKLSDSGVYSSLRLGTIKSAIIDEGIFHNNVILNVQLESPYFKSGKSLICLI